MALATKGPPAQKTGPVATSPTGPAAPTDADLDAILDDIDARYDNTLNFLGR